VYVQGSSAPKSHRDMCMNELVTTEENYVKCLDMIIKVSSASLYLLLQQIGFSHLDPYAV